MAKDDTMQIRSKRGRAVKTAGLVFWPGRMRRVDLAAMPPHLAKIIRDQLDPDKGNLTTEPPEAPAKGKAKAAAKEAVKTAPETPKAKADK